MRTSVAWAVVVLAASVAAAGERPRAGTALTFNGGEYLHRWSMNGQNEYTPKGEEDLEAWKSMVTLNLHGPTDGEKLAQIAGAVANNYAKSGTVLRTDSKPRTAKQEAEHFVAAVMSDGQRLEAAF